jgi:peptidoglycan/LPS O-acetylase OafA/YrhL
LEESQKRHEFQTLDALRGVAATLVVVIHFASCFGWYPQHGYLAVDMFFILSGFVLSHAYQSRLDSGRMSVPGFLRVRAIRLAPLYYLGLLAGVVVTASTHAYAKYGVTMASHLQYFALNAFLLPVRGPSHVPPFPYNDPSWTLFLEFLVNAVHALFLRRASTGKLALVCGVAGAALVGYYVHAGHLNAGWAWPGLFTIGLARVMFSYPLGMLLYRLWSSHKARIRFPASLSLCLAAAILAVRLPHEAEVALIAILVAVPAVVYLAACNEPPAWLRLPFGLLGGASYAIYVLHWPFFSFATHFWGNAQQNAPLSGLLLLAALLCLSLAADAVYDRPVRKWLMRTLSRQREP